MGRIYEVFNSDESRPLLDAFKQGRDENGSERNTDNIKQK
jgi:hypothetical protein